MIEGRINIEIVEFRDSIDRFGRVNNCRRSFRGYSFLVTINHFFKFFFFLLVILINNLFFDYISWFFSDRFLCWRLVFLLLLLFRIVISNTCRNSLFDFIFVIFLYLFLLFKAFYLELGLLSYMDPVFLIITLFVSFLPLFLLCLFWIFFQNLVLGLLLKRNSGGQVMNNSENFLFLFFKLFSLVL